MSKIHLRYATGSPFKREEMGEIVARDFVEDRYGRAVQVGEQFAIDYEAVQTDEPLERDLVRMVSHKARSAYQRIMAPCLVEHAGLIMDAFEVQSYPGGLTQPMWDALGAKGFVESVRWAGDRAIARAVVGYCDGLQVRTFVGETRGRIVPEPREGRGFYWDTVFCPDGETLTYAELSASPTGLRRKVALSQSTKAMKACFGYVLSEPAVMFSDLT